jgi:hypothetical protein
VEFWSVLLLTLPVLRLSYRISHVLCVLTLLQSNTVCVATFCPNSRLGIAVVLESSEDSETTTMCELTRTLNTTVHGVSVTILM